MMGDERFGRQLERELGFGPWLHSIAHPSQELFAVQCASSYGYYCALGLLKAGIQFESVKDQERLQRGVSNTLVAIDKWMIGYQREAESSGLCRQTRVEVVPAEGHSRLCDSRLQGSQIANAFRPTTLLDHQSVKFEHLRKRQIAHSAQASI